MLGSVAPIHVEGEQTALLATDVTSQALQGSLVMVPGRAVTCYEGQDVGHERYDAVRIKVIGIDDLRRKCTDSQCEPPSVLESALIMTVQVFVFERGRRSEA